MPSKKQLIIGSLVTVTLVGIGGSVYYFNRPQNTTNQTTSSSISDISVSSNTSTTTSTETSSVESVPETTESQQNVVSDADRIYDPQEVADLLGDYYFSRSESMDIEASKTELRKIISNDDVYNTLVATLETYKTNLTAAIESNSFGTWNSDNPNNYKFSLTNDDVLSVKDYQTTEEGTYTVMYYLKQTIADGYDNSSKGYVKIAFRTDDHGRITSYSESNFIDENTLE